MAFITNQKGVGSKKLGDRLAELMAHSDRLDMLVGFFFFSGVKVLYDAIKSRANMKLRVLVGMEAEMAMGHLVESLKKDGNNSADAIKNRFLDSMRKIVGSSEADTSALEAEIDQLVYKLYGLTEEEIAVVEGRDKTAAEKFEESPKPSRRRTVHLPAAALAALHSDDDDELE